MRALVPVLALLMLILVCGGLVLVSGEIRSWLAQRSVGRAEQAKAAALRSARWETYADPGKGGYVRIGVRQVARWGGHEVTLKDDLVESVAETDSDRRTAATTVAMDRRDFFNGLLPKGGDPDAS